MFDFSEVKNYDPELARKQWKRINNGRQILS